MEAALAANAEAGLPAIDVSAAQGKYLQLLVRMTGAKRILEVRTLGGYSTLWMASALTEDGQVVTLEYDPRHAEVARGNFARAGFEERIALHVGAAADTLPKLTEAGAGPFDLVFIDADKPSNVIYLKWAMKLGRPGTVIVLDNVIRGGGIIDPNATDHSVMGTQAALAMIANEPRLNATALQTVGTKGWDGFAIMILDA
ncbi:O-methyltransferase [Devosia sp.]|uniref:O-methyltransferase n=1 Tax=Devosia sp. TaxID=1871048 RepID=UPI003A910D7E